MCQAHSAVQGVFRKGFYVFFFSYATSMLPSLERPEQGIVVMATNVEGGLRKFVAV